MKGNTLKRKQDKNGSYYYDLDQRSSENNALSLYQEVTMIEEKRIFEYGFDELSYIEDEIRIRVRITKHEIFRIGELLMISKKVCQEQKIGFQNWIDESFDFSYETAKNFMNVWKHCLAYRTVALEVPTSVLYRIAQPSFPDELREYLFVKGNLDKITDGKVKKLIAKFEEGGIEAIKKDLVEANRILGGVHLQTNFTIDMCTNALRTIQELKAKIEKHGTNSSNYIDFIGSAQNNEPEACKINENLYTAIDGSIDSLGEAIENSRNILEDLKNDGLRIL